MTAAEFDGLQTLAEMPEHEPGAVPRYTVILSEADLRDGLGLLRDGAGFAAAADPKTLARAAAAGDFLGVALPAAAVVFARLLARAEPSALEEAQAAEAKAAADAEEAADAAEAVAVDAARVAATARTAAEEARASPAAVGEAQEAFHAVMERTSFAPALWATVPLEAVGRLVGGVGQEEQGDEHTQAVGGPTRPGAGHAARPRRRAGCRAGAGRAAPEAPTTHADDERPGQCGHGCVLRGGRRAEISVR